MSTYRRVTVTVPAVVLEAGDELAARLDRSRSWVVSEALRRYAGGEGAAVAAAPSHAVREDPAPLYGVQQAFRAAELSRLESDLALSPEQRVRLSEELARTVASGWARPHRRQVLQFDSFEDYLRWKRLAEVQP